MSSCLRFLYVGGCLYWCLAAHDVMYVSDTFFDFYNRYTHHRTTLYIKSALYCFMCADVCVLSVEVDRHLCGVLVWSIVTIISLVLTK